MDLETALTRAGYILDRYRDQPPEVLRVINCYDVEAIAVLVEAARPLMREPGAAPAATTGEENIT